MSAPRVVIAGAGIAGAEVALGLAGTGVEVTIVAPERALVLPSLDPGWQREARLVRVALADLADRCGARLLTDRVIGVREEDRCVLTSMTRVVPYDRLVVAVGVRRTLAVNGAVHLGDPRSLHGAKMALELVRGGWSQRPAVVVPDPSSWSLPAYEIALEASTYDGARPTIVTAERAPAAAFGDPAAKTVAEILVRHGIELHVAAESRDFVRDRLVLAGGGEVDADQVLSLPRLLGPAVPGLPSDARGFLEVDAEGRVIGADDVWAAGDVVAGTVKQGGVAAQQGAAVAECLLGTLDGAGEARTGGHPILRGILDLPDGRLFLERDPEMPRARVSSMPLWSPPARLVGVHLGGDASYGFPAALTG